VAVWFNNVSCHNPPTEPPVPLPKKEYCGQSLQSSPRREVLLLKLLSTFPETILR
jgi:hypothetical protein